MTNNPARRSAPPPSITARLAIVLPRILLKRLYEPTYELLVLDLSGIPLLGFPRRKLPPRGQRQHHTAPRRLSPGRTSPRFLFTQHMRN